MLKLAYLAALCAAALSPACAQEATEAASKPHEPSAECVATYRLGDRKLEVTTTDMALEFARRYRLEPRGQDALTHLVDRTLVAEAAAKKGVTPTRREINDYISELSKLLDKPLESFLAEKNVSRESFERDYVVHSLAHEKLVIEAAGLQSREDVTPELLELWLEEARQREKVVTDATTLPAGIVARIGKTQLGMIELGEVLFANASRDTIEHQVHQVVVREVLEHAAETRGLDVSREEIEAEIATKRKRIESDPSFGGIGFAEILKTQGMTIDDLRRSPVLRAQVFRRKLVEHEFPDEVVDAKIEADEEAVRMNHGARRHLHIVLVRASDPPSEFIPRSFEDAKEHIERVKARLDDGMAFATAAKLHSDEPNSKMRGGDIGMHHSGATNLPHPVVEAAFDLEPFEVSDPVRTELGWFLVMVSDVEDEPSRAVLRDRLRGELAQQLVIDLLAEADVTLVKA